MIENGACKETLQGHSLPSRRPPASAYDGATSISSNYLSCRVGGAREALELPWLSAYLGHLDQQGYREAIFYLSCFWSLVEPGDTVAEQLGGFCRLFAGIVWRSSA